MGPWRVRDVLTTDVVTAREDTPVAEIADLLAAHRVSGVPIVGADRRVLGVVSEADFLPKVAATGAVGSGWRPGRRRTAKAAATSARELMSRPALTIASDEPLSAAARKMQAKKVKRLLVTSDTGELVGIVTRADLLRPYARPDDAIQRDIIEHVLRRTLWIDTSQVQAAIDAGVVTLAGAVGRRTTAALAERLVADVPGVVAVVNEIRYDFDDTALARSRAHRTNPLSAVP